MIGKQLLIFIVTLSTLQVSLAKAQSATTHIFKYKSHMIPHPDKAHKGGQDAFFDSERMLVISDGVGGWNQQGIDPSQYSRFLCKAASNYLQENQKYYVENPKAVIVRAQSENKNVGSATMEVLTLENTTLRYCFIGDSGFMVIRKFQEFISIFEYVEQQHRFNYPYQLGMQEYGGDDPHLAICGILELQEGDIIVGGSDGLYDNFDFYEVVNAVRAAHKNDTLFTTLAEELASKAIKRGKSPNFSSPFGRRAKEQKAGRYQGGKLDDTTVIVAEVVKKPNPIQNDL